MDTSSDSSTMLNFLLLGIIAVAVIGAQLWHRWSIGRRLRSSDDTADDSSAILSYYTAGHDVVNVARGKAKGMGYTAYLTSPPSMQHGMAFTNETALIYVLELPFNTQTHLVGLTKSIRLDRLQFGSFLSGLGMQRTELEGDFPDYFDIYATDGQGFNVQYVLDPDTMAFVVDYCRTHFWELHDAELYLVVTESTREVVDLVTEGGRFVESIRPALSRANPDAPVVHHQTPYGEYSGPPLLCPLCKQKMQLHDVSWFSCPQGHGALLTGRNLKDLNAHELSIAADADKTVEHGPLTCPNCKSAMQHVQYDGGNLQIDSCPDCTYRWLDASEIANLNTSRV